MSGFEKITIGSLFQKLFSVVAVALFLTPSAADAESLLLLHKGGSHLVPETVRQTVKKPAEICLDENGDLVIKHSGILLTLAHTPPDEIIERLRIAQRQDFRSISDISLKISFLF